jgi:prolyl 4-hydroxylase
MHQRLHHTKMITTHLLPFPLLALLNIATASRTQNYTCPQHLYNIQIFSEDPLIIYIPSFITEYEASHLQSLSSRTLERSRIADQTGQQHLASTRTSRSTSLNSDKVVRCIEDRALQFQGYDTPRTHLEPLQAVQYSVGENYKPHTDWFTSPAQITDEFGGNRATSFFVYVSASEDIIGGGTQFPLLDAPHSEKWCPYVNCDAGWEEGVTFRPIARNAVFWRNMKSGEGDRRTLHAGLPVQRGEKLGMNIWTREGVLDEKYRSDGV